MSYDQSMNFRGQDTSRQAGLVAFRAAMLKLGIANKVSFRNIAGGAIQEFYMPDFAHG